MDDAAPRESNATDVNADVTALNNVTSGGNVISGNSGRSGSGAEETMDKLTFLITWDETEKEEVVHEERNRDNRLHVSVVTVLLAGLTLLIL